MGRFIIMVLIALAPPLALVHADEREWRFGIGGGGTVVNARAGGADGTRIGLAARGRLGHGLSDTIELGVVAGYARASDVAFEGATLGGQTGKLFADISMFTFGAELRWTPGLGFARAFERTSPYVTARAGAALALRTSQQVLTPTNLLLLDASNDLDLAAFAGGALGVEHRFGDHFFLAAELAASFSVDHRSLGLTAEAAWAWY